MEVEKGVVLLGLWVNPFVQRCHVALADKGVQCEYQEEDKADKSLLLLQSNPVHKKVPVLIHDSKPVCKPLVIIEYIDEVWPAATPILPKEPYACAHDRFWADFVDKKICEGGARLMKLKGEAHEEAKKEYVKNVNAADIIE